MQWGTETMGRAALRAIISHRDLELVGLWAGDGNEAGADAGQLAGAAPIGVSATDDVEALLALIPDCVCYIAAAEDRPEEARAELTRILSSGANVVAAPIAPLTSGAESSSAGSLAQAAEEAAASIYVPGRVDGDLMATAMRLVNAIPAVCRARPGLLSDGDISLEEVADTKSESRPKPPFAGDERDTLNGFLDFLRATVERKVAGLDHAQIRQPLVASSPLMTPGGVVKHLVAVERWWFSEVLGDGAAPPLFSADDHDFEFRLTDGETAESLLADYAAECERSRAIVAAMELTQVAERRRQVSVRWVLTHMIEETARHVGHLDLLRESLDGATGE